MPPAATTRTTAACTTCGSPTSNGTTLCRNDTDYLRDELAWVADRHLADELLTTFVRQARTGPAQRRGGSGRPLPWSEAASDALRRLELSLAAWCATVDPSARVPVRISARAAWLRRALPALRALPQSGEAYTELTEAIHRARVTVDTPAESSRFPVGPCPEWLPHGTDAHRLVRCDGTVRAFIGAGDSPSLMRCSACRATWATDQWLRAGRRILARMAAA